MDLGSAWRAVCQMSGSYLFPPASPGNAVVHLNTDVTIFVGDHVFFSLTRNTLYVILFFFFFGKGKPRDCLHQVRK